jgi:hypothetical protein
MDSDPSRGCRAGRDLEGFARAGQDAALGLTDVARVLDDIAIDLSFARHADRKQLRQASERLESIARTLVGETGAGSPMGAKHAAILGKVALAAAAVAVLPFAEGVGRVAGRGFKSSYACAMKSLERLHHHAEAAQSATRRDLSLQITGLSGQLRALAAEVGVEMTDHLDLGQMTSSLQVPTGFAFDRLREAIEMVPSDPPRAVEDRGHASSQATDGLLETLAAIEYRIAEVFAQLVGDATS